MRRLAALFAWVLFSVQGCVKHVPPPLPPLVASPHYVLGAPYEAGGHWYYPAESYSLVATGIASVAQDDEAGLTADGELRDPGALTAAMQTIQLPAIVQVTNLENGRQIRVRVNDRGPASPGRIIAISPRAALLLQIPAGGAARVRVAADETLSHRLVDQLGGGPKLQIATAPKAAITEEALPAGGGAAGPARSIGGTAAEVFGPRVPDRLPEQILSTYADPGSLYLECGSFGRATYAHEVAAELSGLGADVQQSRDGRQTVFSVRVGPFASIAAADRALAEALRDGVIDAHIVVE